MVRMQVIAAVITGGYQWPRSAILTMRSPAPRNRYQGPPNTMQPACSRAASADSVAPISSGRLCEVLMMVGPQYPPSLHRRDHQVPRERLEPGTAHGTRAAIRLAAAGMSNIGFGTAIVPSGSHRC